MLSYGNIYEFAFDSQNGADFLIVISKKYYSGEVMRRPLGRAPILKRENNGHIYGTSLEIYAECTVDWEYAQFYTSDAFEFRVQLYKNGSLLWMGYVSPELYSEPDVAPPYDVQIIATDSLGELKNYAFASNGTDSLLNHLNHILGMSLSYQMISDLRYEKSSGAISNSSSEIMNVRIDLGHEDGESCYDVLQRLLESFNLNITQYNERWLLFRETDLINLASSDGVIAHDSSGSQVLLDIAHFGSMNECEWWPVGQLSTVIEPARKKVTVQSPNHYANNALNAADWDVSNGASYDSTAGAYILPDEGSYIVQRLDFQEEVGYRLVLNVSARNVGDGDEDQPLGVQVRIDGRGYGGEHQYWLIQQASSDRGVGAYVWKESEGAIEAELAVPSDSDTSADAQNIEIILPLYSVDPARFLYATSVEVTIFNPQGTHDIHVYGVQLSKYDQSEGYQSDVKIDNGAREEGDDITMSLTDGSTMPAAGRVFMTGVPIEYPDIVIKKWAAGADDPDILLTTISKDYARAVALPRMRYTGSLNVPKGMTIPVLFVRDNTFYFPKTYSYDLWNDEVEVDLISVPAAEVSIASSVISQMASSGASSSGGSGSGGGGGIGTGIDLSGFARKDDLTALSELLASMWSIDPDTGALTTDKDVVINGNLIVKKNSASGGTNDPSTNIGTVDHIVINGKGYYPDNAGIVDLSEAFEGLQVDVDLSGYLKTTDIADWAKAATKPSYTKAEVGLGNVDNTADSAKSVLYAATAGSAPASDVYAWAKKSSLALSDVPDLSDKYLPLSGGLMQGTILPNLHNHLEIGEWETSFYAINSNYYRAGSNINNLWLVSGAGTPDRGIVFARTSDGSTYTQVGKWTSVGLGIGTISPEYKLDIEGYVRATKFILNKQESGIWAGSSYSTTYAADSVLINGTHIYLASITTLLSGLNVKSSAVFEQDVTIEGNLIVKGDSASGGTSASNTAYLPLSGGTMVSGAGIYNPNGSASYAAVAFNTNANAFGDPYFPTILRSSLDVTLNKAGTTYTLVHTGNISSYALPKSGGALTGDLTIDGNTFIRGVSTNPYIRFTYGGQNWYCQAYTTNSKIGIFLGVASSLSLKVDASGNVTYAGTISGASDIRYKNKKYDYTLDLHSIANAPLFAFTWNDRNDPDPHLGTSAQYWESIVPQLVSGTDFKALDYSTLGVAMGISLAKKTLNHEERIKALESENKALKEQLSELYNGTVC